MSPFNLKDSTQSIRVLHVDDESGILQTTKQILELDGAFNVTSVNTVNDALKLIEDQDFDVVVSDYQLPEKDGLMFLSELREKGSNIPFILFTGKGREDVAIKALNLGANYFLNKLGRPETVYGELSHIIKQVVNQQRAEIKLDSERKRLQTVTEHMSAGLAVISKDYRLLWVNNVLEKIFGCEYGGKKCHALINHLSSPCGGCRVNEIFENGKDHVVHEQLVKAPDGSDVWLEITVTPIKDSRGNVVSALELVHDITDRKKAAILLKESEARFKQLFSRMPSGALIYEPINNGEDFIIREFNETAKHIEQLSPTDVIGKRISEVFPGVKEFGLVEVLQRISRSGKPEFLPTKLYTDNRLSGWRENWIYKLPNNNLVVIYNDVTEKKRTEEKIYALQKSIDQSDFGVAILSFDGINLYSNEGTRRMWGFSEDDVVVGIPINTAYVPEEQEKIDHVMKQLMREGSWSGEIVAKRKDGSTFDVQVSASRVDDSTGKPAHIIAYYLDVTEKNKVQKHLKEHQQFLDTIIKQNPYPIYVSDAKGTLIKANKALLKLLRISEDEVVGKYNLLKDSQVANQGLLPLVKKAFNGETVNFIIKYKTTDVKQLTLTDRTSDVILETTIAPILDEKGHVKNAIVVHIDVTEHKKIEKEMEKTAENLALVNEKLGVVGKLTRHDARNKLSVILNNVYLAKKRLAENHRALDSLKGIELAVDQISNIFDFSKAYEQLGVTELSYVDVGKSFERAISLRVNYGTIQVFNECDGIKVLADPLLETLFYNLVDNSIKHGKKVSAIRLCCNQTEDSLKLFYEDNGVGVPQEEKEKVFLEGYGKGTGLGLYLIKLMCDVYGFKIKETGVPNKGARFEITIPKNNYSKLIEKDQDLGFPSVTS